MEKSNFNAQTDHAGSVRHHKRPNLLIIGVEKKKRIPGQKLRKYFQ